MNFRIRGQILTFALILIILPVIAVGFTGYSIARTALLGQIEKLLTSQALAWKREIRHSLNQIEDLEFRESSLIRQNLASISRSARSFIQFYGENQGEEDSLKAVYDYIATIRVGTTGYVFVLDEEGNYVVSAGRQRDGENLWNAKDSSGNYFIRDMIIQGKDLQGDQVYYLSYPWERADTGEIEDKISAITYSQEFNLVIGAGSYVSEFQGTLLREDFLESIKTDIAREVIGETGYTWILDSQGNYIVSSGRSADGQNIYNAKDADGELFVQEMIEGGMAHPEDSVFMYYYEWANEGEDQARTKVAAVTYLPELDWLIGPSSYHEEFLDSLEAVRFWIVVIALAAIGMGTIASFLFANNIAKPVNTLTEYSRDIAIGKLVDVDMDMNRRDEIGELAQSFQQMSASIQKKAEELSKIAEGNLGSPFQAEGEHDLLGKSLMRMKAFLTEMIESIYTAIDQVTISSDHLAESSQSVSQGATEQAAALEQMTSMMNEITQLTKDNAAIAEKTAFFSQDVVNLAQDGSSELDHLAELMKEINDSTNEIKAVVKIIDDISFQINLLALNANVEAARAGKYGKGFGVVAEEVRNLAGRSANATVETNAKMEETVKKIITVSETTEATVTKFQAILSKVEEISSGLNQMNESGKQEAQRVVEVNAALNDISTVTQGNSAAAEESASAAEELKSQADQLEGQISRFTLNQEDPKLLP